VALPRCTRTASHRGSNIRLQEINGEKPLSRIGDEFAGEIT